MEKEKLSFSQPKTFEEFSEIFGKRSEVVAKSSKTSFLVALYIAWLFLDIKFLFSRSQQSLVITDLNTRRKIPCLSEPMPSLYISFVNNKRFVVVLLG